MTGKRFGNYEIGAQIGAGGMGEVYRGRDTKLNRDVAIKVLLSAVAKDSERLARFDREAQVLASLNHPNIAHIHGVEQGPDGPLLVLEYVDGPTLADRIAAGPIPADEAIAIAKQIADALEAAHERGIVHRDLKPANIKVDDHGTVKVLDFGLAKSMEATADSSSAHSPTITTPAMTQAGMILGTAAYMSPEQAKGRVVDKRSDVWAFGCVLYEMLTATRAFGGEDVTDTIAAIVRGEPDWTKLPADTPAQIRLLIKRCLEKDRKARISDIGVARFLMHEGVAAADVPAATPATRRGGALFAIGGAIVGILLMAGVWKFTTVASLVSPRPMRFAVSLAADHPLILQGNDRDIEMAPDGSFVVYRSGNAQLMQTHLMIRRVGELDAREIPGTTNARQPFLSPDGSWVGFFVAGQMMKVPIGGGSPVPICRVTSIPRGASWSDADWIVFPENFGNTRGMMRVSASGGEPTLMLAEDDKFQFAYPFVMPGSKQLLFTSFLNGSRGVRVESLDIASGKRAVVIEGGLSPSYVDGGYLVFGEDSFRNQNNPEGRGSLLRAVRFDATRSAAVGEPVTLVDGVAISSSGAANYAVSRSGDVVYVPGSLAVSRSNVRNLVWVDRKGQETPIPAPQHSYAVARVSPDGTRVALDVRDQGNDIWIWDIRRETLSLLNLDAGQDMSPVWTPDSKKVMWGSTRAGGNPNVYSLSADGGGTPDRVTSNPTNQFPTSISPDGRTLILFGAFGTAMDIFSVDLTAADRPQRPLIGTVAAMDFGGEVSPDGKWIVYHSNDSGEFQVYVRPFPNVNDRRWQISPRGGSRAVWARNGRELFYLDRDGLLTSVPVEIKGDSFTAGAAAKLLNTKYYLGSTLLGLDLRSYDVAPDGQRFLMLKDIETPKSSDPVQMVVVLNGASDLKARLPPQ